MNAFKKFLNSSIAVLAINILLAVFIHYVLVCDYQISILLMVVFTVGVLILDRFGVVNAVFDAYINHKGAAIASGIPLLILIPISLTNQNYIAHIGCLATCYAIGCLGLNYQMGSIRMTNFAPAAFMGFGAYSVGVATMRFGASPWIGMLFGVLLAGLFGLIVALITMNTKGYYLSLITTAVQISFTQIVNTIGFLGGADGLNKITRYAIGGLQLYKKYTVFGIKFAAQVPYMLLCLLFLVLVTYVSMRVGFAKYGLSLNTIAKDDIAAQCFGIDHKKGRIFAFCIGGLIMGLAGSLLVGLEGYVGPDSYNFNKSIMLLCMVILGGLDNPVGVICGAFLLTIMSEKLRDFSDYQQLMYGIVMVLILIVRPNGIIPKRIRNYCGICKRTLQRAPKAADVPEAFEAQA